MAINACPDNVFCVSKLDPPEVNTTPKELIDDFYIFIAVDKMQIIRHSPFFEYHNFSFI